MHDLRKLVVPEILYGSGARFLAGQYAHNFGIHRALLVSDPGVRGAGWAREVAQALRDADCGVIDYGNVTPNPKDGEVMEGAALYRKERCNGIVVVGGGSPIDCAKGIGIVSSNGGHINDYEGVDMASNPCPPLICIPTTAGTGSDVSQFAIILDTSRKTKIAIISKSVVPDISLTDPDTTATMDPALTAATGLDALTHAVEAYVSNASSPLTSLHALEAMRQVARHLKNAILAPDDPAAREGMMLGSLQAGIAFSNASLGMVHAMAHALGGLMDLPHGLCNALLLPHVARYNYSAAETAYNTIAQILTAESGGAARPPVESIAAFVHGILEAAQLSTHLAALGVTGQELAGLAGNAFRDPCLVTNPKRPEPRDIESVYAQSI